MPVPVPVLVPVLVLVLVLVLVPVLVLVLVPRSSFLVGSCGGRGAGGSWAQPS